MDFVSFIFDFPTYIENVVKACEQVQKYKAIEEDHTQLISEVVATSVTLKEYAQIAQSIQEDQVELRESLTDYFTFARSSLRMVEDLLNEWNNRLGIPMRAGGIRGLVLKDLIYSLEKGFAKGSKRSKERSSRPRFKGMVADAKYLSLGASEIREHLVRLDGWVNRICHLIMVIKVAPHSPSLHSTPTRSSQSDVLVFLEQARIRDTSNYIVLSIPPYHTTHATEIDNNQCLLRITQGKYKDCIWDRRDHFVGAGENHSEEIRRDSHRLFRLLAEDPNGLDSHVTISVGLLRCCGVSEEEEENTTSLIFRLPYQTGHICTLRSLLLHKSPLHPLEDRLRLACRLATSVLVVHSLGVVHKDIRPDSIILTYPKSEPASGILNARLGSPFLLSFHQARSRSSRSGMRYVSDHWRRIYTHPRHLGTERIEKWGLRDDIYSLGVCLLEIALWRSMFYWDDAAEGLEDGSDVIDLSDSGSEEIDSEASGFEVSESTEEGLEITSGDERRHFNLVKAARTDIPIVMGSTFSEVVGSCLTFGEDDIQLQSSLDTTKEALNFINDVVFKLRDLKL